MNEDLSATVGVEEYPAPGSLTIITSNLPFLIVASATAPEPPPPVTITAGACEYPVPGSVMVILSSILVEVSCAFIGNDISGRNV